MTSDTAIAQHQRVRAIYDAHYERVYFIALRYSGGRRAWAEDITQDVFFTLVDRLADVREDVDAGPWLSRVTVNKCLNKLRRERLWRTLSVGLITPKIEATDPEALVGARESVQRAWQMLQALPPKERVAFMMYRLDGLTMDEIAEQLDYSKGYVSKLVKRAHERLERRGWRDE